MTTTKEGLKQTKKAQDKKATAALIKWFKDYNWNRGGLPFVGISMFNVQGLGVPVQVTQTGQALAYFSSYDAASLALSKADRSILHP
jgi:hypothetical protein